MAWVKRIHALASTGLHFGAHPFDQERYEEIAQITQHMLADLGRVPIATISQQFPEFGRGYATPQVDVRGAVFNGSEVLLVQEKSDGLWTLPGGYADVGLSAAENVVKEVREEASLTVECVKLYAVRHKAKHPYRADVRDFYKFFYLCRNLDGGSPAPGYETNAAQYFPLNQLPPLSTARTIEADLQLADSHRRDPQLAVFFD